MQVSRALVTLMPSVPFKYDYDRVSQVCSYVCPSGCMSGHGGIVAGAVPVAAVPAVLSFAAVSPTESIPMACGTMSVDIVSHVEGTVNAPALGQPKAPSLSMDTFFTIFNFNVQGLF